jgi:hypothetical protein
MAFLDCVIPIELAVLDSDRVWNSYLNPDPGAKKENLSRYGYVCFTAYSLLSIRTQILLFSSVAFKMPTKVFLLITF